MVVSQMSRSRRRKLFWRYFTFTVGLSFLAGLAICYGLKYVIGDIPIAYFYGMYTYPDDYPWQYVAVVVIPYSFLSTLWAVYMWPARRRLRPLQILCVLAASLFVGGLFGGILYFCHYTAARDADASEWIKNIMIGAAAGTVYGPIMFILSIRRARD